MASFTRIPDIHRGELAQQSLWLRLGLIPLFALVTLWVSESQHPVILALLAYSGSSALLAAGYRVRVFGSSDVIYLGMVDTSLFLGAGVAMTGGAASPVLFLFFGLQAAYFILARPRAFVVTAAFSLIIMIASVALATYRWPAKASPGEEPLAYVVAAVGALAMLSGVGWFHSLVYVGRSQASQHFTAAANALRQLVSGGSEEKLLAAMLDALMTTLHITDEGTIYRHDPQHGVLRHQLSLGLRPWFQRFQEFQPDEGMVGQALAQKRPIACHHVKDLYQCLGSLGQSNLAVLNNPSARSTTPSYALALPLCWGEEVMGVLVLTRYDGSRPLDEKEIQLAEAFASYMVIAMRQSYLGWQVAQLDQETTLQRQLWLEKARQLDSLREIVSLSHSGGNQEKVVKSIIQWALKQIDELEPASVFAVLSDEPKGSMTLTVAAPDAEEGPQETSS
jgi:hypothetical protein